MLHVIEQVLPGEQPQLLVVEQVVNIHRKFAAHAPRQVETLRETHVGAVIGLPRLVQRLGAEIFRRVVSEPLGRRVRIMDVHVPVPKRSELAHCRAEVVRRVDQAVEFERVVRVPHLQIVLARAVIAISSELSDRAVGLHNGNVEARRPISPGAGIGQVVLDLELYVLPAFGAQFKFQAAGVETRALGSPRAPVRERSLGRLFLRVDRIHEQVHLKVLVCAVGIFPPHLEAALRQVFGVFVIHRHIQAQQALDVLVKAHLVLDHLFKPNRRVAALAVPVQVIVVFLRIVVISRGKNVPSDGGAAVPNRFVAGDIGPARPLIEVPVHKVQHRARRNGMRDTHAGRHCDLKRRLDGMRPIRVKGQKPTRDIAIGARRQRVGIPNRVIHLFVRIEHVQAQAEVDDHALGLDLVLYISVEVPRVIISMRHFVKRRGSGPKIARMPFVDVLRLVRKARFEQIVFVDLAREIHLDGRLPVERVQSRLIHGLLPAADHRAHRAGGEPLGFQGHCVAVQPVIVRVIVEALVVHIVAHLVVLNAELHEGSGTENVCQLGHRRIGADVLRRTRVHIAPVQHIGRICRPLVGIVRGFDFRRFVVARIVPNIIRR